MGCESETNAGQRTGVVANLELRERSEVGGSSGIQGRVRGRGSGVKPKAFLFLDIPMGHFSLHLKIS